MLSDTAYDADPASTGMASMPVPIIPIANSVYEKLPANGLSASAASAAVLIPTIPLLKSVAAHAAIIKNITTLEKNIPVQTSVRMRLISLLWTAF